MPPLLPADGGAGALGEAIEQLCQAADQAVRSGYSVLILSDRGVSTEMAAIPSLLACAAVHHHLIRDCTRTMCGLVLASAEPREVHPFAR